MPAGKQATISKFMEQLSQVEGFTVDLETLEKFASKIPASTGVKPTKHRDGPRAKTAYNVWCATHWAEHCETEYGRKLPLADVKFKDGDQKGEVKLSAHTDERKQMWTDFQETPQFQEMKSEIEAENEKLGKVPTKRKATKADEISRLMKELEEERAKNKKRSADSDSDSDSDSEDSDSDSESDVESKNEKPSDPKELHKHWAISQFQKPTELNCFKSWIMSNDPDSYGEGKKTAIPRDELSQLKEEYKLADFTGKNYTEECQWFEFIPTN